MFRLTAAVFLALAVIFSAIGAGPKIKKAFTARWGVDHARLHLAWRYDERGFG